MLLSVVGARPQFIKAAVVSSALAHAGIAEEIVHTGQHYDEQMSGQFLRQLGISNISANLNCGSGNHAEQTATIMKSFDDFLRFNSTMPEAILVYGDTNSTIAAGLVAAKRGIPLIHIEAGLRSYNRGMPEEINRVIVDHLSQSLFCSSSVGVRNLAKEGIVQNVHNVGDVMLDAYQHFSSSSYQPEASARILEKIKGQFVLVTIHRPSNTDDISRMRSILDGLARLEKPCIWPVHPRNRTYLENVRTPDNLHCISPVGYLEMLYLLNSCVAVATDSGGLQKEAYWARRPCVTIRKETEWVETLEGGWNRLVDPQIEDIAEALSAKPDGEWRLLYGDGHASLRIASHIEDIL